MRNPKTLLVALLLIIAACGGTGANEKETDGSPLRQSTSASDPDPAALILPPQLAAVTGAWDTDFSKRTIDLDELLVGLPSSDPRDGIPPIDNPVFEAVSESNWITDQEPGVLLEVAGDARFYPLSILTRHEIVNDIVGDVPVAVTYCPLCNTAVTFDRRIGETTLRLGVSGLLRNSDLVMWDDETHSLWQQITGVAIVGARAGAQLERLGSAVVRWADFKTGHPEGLVLGPDQGFGNKYGYNPYEFYSLRQTPYGFFTGTIDERFPALSRVVGVTVGTSEKAYPFSLINDVGVVNDMIGDQPVVVFWGAPDTADALDAGVIADARGIGTGVAYDPVVAGQRLTFAPVSDTEFEDTETGSTWSILGKATSGPLTGESLELLDHRNEFWFAWQAFFPGADVWTP